MNLDVDTIIVILIILITLYLTLFGRLDYIIYLIPFSLSLNFFIEIGTRWVLWKIFAFVYWGGIFLRRTAQSRSIFPYKIPNEFILLFIFIIINTFIQYLRLVRFVSYNWAGVPLFQSINLRTFIQAISNLLKLSYFLIPLTLICNKKITIKHYLLSYLIMTFTLCLYGVYQIIAFRFDLPFRGIKYTDIYEGIGAFSVYENFIFRVNSLANEPKQLSLFLLPSIFILFYTTFFKFERSLRSFFYRTWNLILHMFIFVLCFSTAGFAGLALGIIFVIVFNFKFLEIKRFYFFYSLYFSISLFIFSLFLYFKGIEILFEALRYRIIENSLSFWDRMEGVALLYLIKHPQNLFLGFGTGNYNFYIPKTVGTWGVDPIVSDAITMLLDNGIIGLLLNLLLFKKVFSSAIISFKSNEKENLWLTIAVIGLLLAFSGYIVLGGTHLFMYFLGIVWAYTQKNR